MALHRVEQALSGKKAKKAQKQSHTLGPYGAATSTAVFDPNDQVALNRRAERFHREHELERTKVLRVSGGPSISESAGPSSIKANTQNAHLFESKSFLSRSASPYGLEAAAADDPEADPVCTAGFHEGGDILIWFGQNVIDWDRHTIVGTSQEIFKDYLRLTTVRGLTLSMFIHSSALITI